MLKKKLRDIHVSLTRPTVPLRPPPCKFLIKKKLELVLGGYITAATLKVGVNDFNEKTFFVGHFEDTFIHIFIYLFLFVLSTIA